MQTQDSVKGLLSEMLISSFYFLEESTHTRRLRYLSITCRVFRQSLHTSHPAQKLRCLPFLVWREN